MVRLTLHGRNSELQFGTQQGGMSISGNANQVQFEGGNEPLLTIERDDFDGGGDGGGGGGGTGGDGGGGSGGGGDSGGGSGGGGGGSATDGSGVDTSGLEAQIQLLQTKLAALEAAVYSSTPSSYDAQKFEHMVNGETVVDPALVRSSVAANVIGANLPPPGFEIMVDHYSPDVGYYGIFGPSSLFAPGGNGDFSAPAPGSWIGFGAWASDKLMPKDVMNCPGIAIWWAIVSKMDNPGGIFTVPDGLASHTGGATNPCIMEAFKILSEILTIELRLGYDTRDASTQAPGTTNPHPDLYTNSPVSERLTEAEIDEFVHRMAALKDCIDAIPGFGVDGTLGVDGQPVADAYGTLMRMFLLHLVQHLGWVAAMSGFADPDATAPGAGAPVNPLTTKHALLGGLTINEYFWANYQTVWVPKYIVITTLLMADHATGNGGTKSIAAYGSPLEAHPSPPNTIEVVVSEQAVVHVAADVEKVEKYPFVSLTEGTDYTATKSKTSTMLKFNGTGAGDHKVRLSLA